MLPYGNKIHWRKAKLLACFEKFNIENSLIQETSKLNSILNDVNLVEIWNDTTINSSLQQIIYYFEFILRYGRCPILHFLGNIISYDTTLNL